MFNSDTISSLKQKFPQTRSLLILLPPQPDPEIALPAISLLLSLEKAGKQIQLGCSDTSNLQNQNFPHLDRIQSDVGHKNLIINFKYQEKHLDKVDYDVDDQGNFYLLIKPRKNSPAPDTSKIKYSHSGVDADLVFTIGINSLEELGRIYSEEKDFLDQADIVSLHQTNKPAHFANFNLHQSDFSGIAEIIASLLSHLNIAPTKEAATLLVSRIYFDTNNLTASVVSAQTMKTLAYLMNHGGKFSSEFLLPTPAFPSTPPPIFSSPPSNQQPSITEDEWQPPTPSEIPPEWKKPKVYRSSSHPDKS